jgi:hypothetical protein
MSRGWESKSVEAQMESSQSGRDESPRKRFTPEMAEAYRKKESLLLARTHLLHQISVSHIPRHREMLENALADLEKQISEIDLGE